jgi:hypothetical protein
MPVAHVRDEEKCRFNGHEGMYLRICNSLITIGIRIDFDILFCIYETVRWFVVKATLIVPLSNISLAAPFSGVSRRDSSQYTF